jgi:hypothetical protein
MKNNRASEILRVLEEAEYKLSNLDSIVTTEIDRLEKRISEIKAMSDEEFRKFISADIFGVAMPEFYVDRARKSIESLKAVKISVLYLLTVKHDDSELFEWELKRYYAGSVREMRRAFDRLSP